MPANVIAWDIVPHAARDIEMAAQELFRASQQAQTVNDALRIYKVTAGLRLELERVIDTAMNRANALCGD